MAIGRNFLVALATLSTLATALLAVPPPAASLAVAQSPYADHVVPGIIEAEDFDNGGPGVAYADLDTANVGSAAAKYRSDEGVDIWNTSGAPGYTVGKTRSNEYLEYTFTLDSAATLDIALRVASGAESPGNIVVRANGVRVGDRVQPTGAGWWAFTTEPAGSVALPAGSHTLRLSFNGGGNINLDRIEITSPDKEPPPVGIQTPFADHNVPGIIEAEDFDNGGPGIAYTDSDEGNLGNATATYRSREDVDIWNTSGAPGYTVGKTRTGETLEYTFTPTTTNNYDIGLHIATGNPAAGTITASINNGSNNQTLGTITSPNNGWWNFTTISAGTINLQAGTPAVLTLQINNGGNINIDHINITPVQTPPPPPPVGIQTPFADHNVPGIIEAEDFDNGGPGIAYTDSDEGNLGNATATYRSREDVDIWNTSGAPGYTVGKTRTGETLEYTFTPTTTNNYDIGLHIATGNPAAGTITASINNGSNNQTLGTITSPNNGWWNFTTISAGTINLQAGTPAVLTLQINNGGNINIDHINITPVQTPPPPPPVGIQTPFADHNVPGIIEAEDFDNGGPGIAYTDSDEGNLGNATATYRSREDVDIWNTSGAPGYTVGKTRTGETLEYTFTPTTTNNYDIGLHIATGNPAAGTITASINNGSNNQTLGTITSPNNGWWNFTTISAGTINLQAGTPAVLTLQINNGGNINIDHINITPVQTPPGPSPTISAMTPGAASPGIAPDIERPSPVLSASATDPLGDGLTYNHALTTSSGQIVDSALSIGPDWNPTIPDGFADQVMTWTVTVFAADGESSERSAYINAVSTSVALPTCERQVAPSITIVGPSGTIDTGEQGTGTGSFTLYGTAIGADEVTITVQGQSFPAIVTPAEDACERNWSAEVLGWRPGQFTFTARAGAFTDSVALTVVPPGADDLLITPAYAATRDLDLRLIAFDDETGIIQFAGDVTEELEPGFVLVDDPSAAATEGFMRVIDAVGRRGDATIVFTPPSPADRRLPSSRRPNRANAG